MTTAFPLRLGITGQSGLIGRNLAALAQEDPRFRLVPFQRIFFSNPEKLASFAAQCDDVVHLAAVSRGTDGAALYRTNMLLTEQIADAALSSPHPPAVFLGSTVQISKDMPYHASKRDGAALLKRRLPCAVELRMPNTFGPGAKPYWNSVVATFCEMAASGGTPEEIRDVELALTGVRDLARTILNIVAEKGPSRTVTIPATHHIMLPELWETLLRWKARRDAGLAIEPSDAFEEELKEMFLSYPFHA